MCRTFSPYKIQDVFATMKAVFWNKTVLGLRPVQELALRHRDGRTGRWPKATAFMSGVFMVFVFYNNLRANTGFY